MSYGPGWSVRLTHTDLLSYSRPHPIYTPSKAVLSDSAFQQFICTFLPNCSCYFVGVLFGHVGGAVVGNVSLLVTLMGLV